MAIGPEQLEDRFKEEVDEFEMIVDRNLMRVSFSNGTSMITIDTPKGLSNSHFLTLKSRYILAGWKDVRRDYGHQRDPYDQIIFEK